VLVPPEVAAAVAAQKPVTDGLVSFQLKPAGLKGMDLFEHLKKYTRRHLPKGEVLEPSAALDVEMTEDQKKIVAPSAEDWTCRELLKDAGGHGATMKLAKRKLDSIGDVKAHCCIANAPERIEKLQRALNLAASISAISRAGKEAKKTKTNAETVLLSVQTPGLRGIHRF
jgi:hypothetical protein